MDKIILDDFFSAVRPLFYISRAVGLAPFVYVKKTLPGRGISLQLRLNSAAIIYSIFVTVFNLFLFLCSTTFKAMMMYSDMTSTDIVPDILISSLSVTSWVSLILSLTKNKSKILKIFFLIQKADCILLTNATEYYKKANTCLFAQLITIFSFLGLTFIYDSIVWTLGTGIKNFAYFHIYLHAIIEWLTVIQFINLVTLLKNRFALLNKRLSSLSGISENENSREGICQPVLKCTSINVKKMKSKLTQEVVLTFNNTHDILCHIALLVKSTYEVQILLTLLSTFVSMTIWLYFGLCYFYGYTSSHKMGIGVSSLVASDMLWCLKHLAKLLFITVSCHLANNEMMQTAAVIRKLHFAASHDPKTVAELDRFSHHVALHQFKFTAFGFLNLDLSLLVSMLGTVATYLVVLLQFKTSAKTSSTCCRNVTE